MGAAVTPFLRQCTLAARIDNAAGVHNEEHGVPVWICAGPLRPWSAEWPQIRHIG